MVREVSKLMLRAYNAEADNCVRTLRPHTLQSAMTRLDKARDTIARLGKTMSIQISERLPPSAAAGAGADRRLPGQAGRGERPHPR